MSQANGNGKKFATPPPPEGESSSQILKVNTGSDLAPTEETPTAPSIYDRPFDQAVVLRQSPLWPRLVVLTILGVVTFGVAWAYFAKLEQAVGATGQLVPIGKVKEVQAPVGGLVKEVLVEDDRKVTAGETILRFDQTAAEAQLKSLREIQQSLRNETRFYRELMSSPTASVEVIEAQVARLNLPIEVRQLTRNRAILLSENRLLRALGESGKLDRNLGPDELSRFQATLQTAVTQIKSAILEKEQLESQLEQGQLQLANATENLAVEQSILEELRPLAEEGAIAKLQFVRQEQTVNQAKGQVDQLTEELQRIRLDINQGNQEIASVRANLRRDLFDRIASNKLQIAQIDSQLTKEIVENEKRIAEIGSQIEQANVQLQYQDLDAPISGTVFDLQVGPGSVANASEVLLKLVPDSELIAEVYVSNRDIGFVLDHYAEAQSEQRPLNVDVRIDSFPFSEFGDITGEVIFIGSDALPPDEIFNFARFPVRVKLATQYLPLGQRQIDLQSGMSLSANIKLNEDRRVINLFVDKFVKAWDTLQQTR